MATDQQTQKTNIPGRQAPVNVIWAPQPGSQALFLSCPVFECLYEGTRGPGKTDALLMDFAQFVGRGFGAGWRGVLFREEFRNLEDVIAKSKRWFPLIFPGAVFNAGDCRWVFPAGEVLLFRHARREEDYWKYHGHEYPWVGWEELTNWPNPGLYLMMKTVCRSSYPGMPRHYRATCNPYGPGHNWVKARFIDPAPRGRIIEDKDGSQRVAIHGTIWENRILLENDPQYLTNLKAQSGPRREAWLLGRWDIVAGGMFDDVWEPGVHVVEPFQVPPSWRLDRSFDWGSAKPYSVGWWAESDGTDIVLNDGSTRPTQRGDLFRVSELYGCTGTPNEGTRELAAEVARRIIERERRMGWRVYPGPADSSIYAVDNGKSIADDMAGIGVTWTPANKVSGSRVNGWELIRHRLKNSLTKEGPGLYVFSACRHFIRTLPVLPRDSHNPDDVDTEAEDHIADETRYRVLARTHGFRSESMG